MRYLIAFICILFIPLSASADALGQAFKDFAAGKYAKALPALEEAAATNADAAFAAGIAHFRIADRLREQGEDPAVSNARSYSYLEMAKTADYPAARSALFELDYREVEFMPSGSPERDAATGRLQAGIDRLADMSMDLYKPYDAIVYLRTPDDYLAKPDVGYADYAANHAIKKASGPLVDWYKAEALTAWGSYHLRQTDGIDALVHPYLVNPHKERAYFAFQEAVRLTGSHEAKQALDRLTADGWSPEQPQTFKAAQAVPIEEPTGPYADGLKAFDRGDFPKAAYLLEEAAAAGDDNAVFAMAYMSLNKLGWFIDRRGTSADGEKLAVPVFYTPFDAIDFLEKSDSPEAQVELAWQYDRVRAAYQKKGGKKDKAKAKELQAKVDSLFGKYWDGGTPYGTRIWASYHFADQPLDAERRIRKSTFEDQSTFMRWDRSENWRILGQRIAMDYAWHASNQEFRRVYTRLAQSMYRRAVAISRNPIAYRLLGELENSDLFEDSSSVRGLSYFLEGAKGGNPDCFGKARESLAWRIKERQDLLGYFYALALIAEEEWFESAMIARFEVDKAPKDVAAAAVEFGEKALERWKEGDRSILSELQEKLKS